jgi:DNA-binding response OmpR family regulator
MADGKILIVEDEFIIAEVMMETLEAAGYGACSHASTVEEALDAVAGDEWGGALLDIRVSRELVFPVAEALRARAVPFAFSSGFGDAADLPAEFHHVPVLHKPWADGQLEQVALSLFGPPQAGSDESTSSSRA